jgi:hypothetical protein
VSTRKGRDFHAEEDALDGGMAYLMYDTQGAPSNMYIRH